MIDEEPSCHKYLQKIGLRNFIKSITGIVILKNVPKMVSIIIMSEILITCFPITQRWISIL